MLSDGMKEAELTLGLLSAARAAHAGYALKVPAKAHLSSFDKRGFAGKTRNASGAGGRPRRHALLVVMTASAEAFFA